MTEFAVVAQDLTRSFGEVMAVNNVDLSIKKGQIYGFLGPNGSGKTTILRLFCGLLTPTDGEVQVLGHPVGQQAEQLRQKIGYMTQKFSLYDDLTIDLGFVKVSVSGSAGGHNGVTSLLDCLGPGFVRYRLGIGPKTPQQMELADFVLGKFNSDQEITLSQKLDHHVQGLELLLSRGSDQAMNQLNRREPS